MFSKTPTKKYTKTCLKNLFDEADAVIIGAGAGLSSSAGFSYSGERFYKYFSDFKDKYGFTDMYSGGFYPYDTLEEYWAYWSRYIYINRYTDAPKPVYNDLFSLIKDKDYFVITTNVDHCFQKAGFDKKRIFYTQGDYGLFQCSVPCHNKTYDNESAVKEMFEKQYDMKIPAELIPKCPLCGEPMTMNLRSDDTFVQDEGWYKAYNNYNDFIRRHQNLKVVFCELGVGMNTPSVIKYPFWQMTAQNPNAVYICINYGEAVCPAVIENRAVCINNDIGEILSELKN